jgi:tRNA threonylcarbamoyladenosine modification (KEOPS) complex  Pcc1 subunit
LEATVTLEYDDVRVAEAVAAAVSPDNYKTPAGMTVTTARRGNAVTTEIRAEGKIATFIATIDDLLFSVSTAEKTVKAVQRL